MDEHGEDDATGKKRDKARARLSQYAWGGSLAACGTGHGSLPCGTRTEQVERGDSRDDCEAGKCDMREGMQRLLLDNHASLAGHHGESSESK